MQGSTFVADLTSPVCHRASFKVHICICVMGKAITRTHIQLGCGLYVSNPGLVSPSPSQNVKRESTV